MLAFNELHLRYDPYPIGVARHVIDPDRYAALVASFPALDLFRLMPGGGKYSLSEVNKPETYREFLGTTRVWQDVYRAVKDPRFVADVFLALRTHHVAVPAGDKFTARFEFSAMPMQGGFLAPHTDLASKVVTIVVAMVAPDPEEGAAFMAGTEVLRPRDPHRYLEDYKVPADAFDVMATLPYRANQAVIFVKTFNSWHSVGPMTGSIGDMRNSITINIERAA